VWGGAAKVNYNLSRPAAIGQKKNNRGQTTILMLIGSFWPFLLIPLVDLSATVFSFFVAMVAVSVKSGPIS
jgi:hypothetical protein